MPDSDNWPTLQDEHSLGATTLERAATEVCRATGIGPLTLVAANHALPRSLCGACVPLVGDQTAFQVALIADRDGLRQLAHAFLQMDPEETLLERDVADAICELSNMLAGRVKALLARQHASLRIGLPLFIDGEMHSHGRGAVALEARFGAIQVTLTLIWRSSDRG